MVDHTDDFSWKDDEPARLRVRSRGSSSGKGKRRFGLRRLAFAGITFVISLVLFVALGAGLLSIRLAHGPIQVGFESQVATALSSRVKHGLKFTVGGTDIESAEGRPTLVVKQLLVRDEIGRSIIRAPEAVMAVDPVQLIGGAVVPTRLDLRDITVKLSILPDGDIAFSAGTEETVPFRVAEAFEGAAPGPQPTSGDPVAPSSDPQQDAVGRMAARLAEGIDKLTGTDEAFGGFDRLGVARGTLILDDRTHNTVTTFRNLELDFDRIAEGATKLTLAADGSAGRWTATVRGVRHADAKRSLAAELQNLTLADVQVLPFLRDVGFDTDVPISGSVAVGLDASGQVAAARAQVRLGSGFFRLNDPDHEPVMLDSVGAAFHYDPAAKVITVEPSQIKAEDTVYRFQGRVTPPTDDLAHAWTIAATGDGVFGAERPGEKPVAFDKIELKAMADPSRHQIKIDKLSLAGPQVATELSADITTGSADLNIKARIVAGRMPAPVILRIWPNLISAKVRAWLIANVQGGTVERGAISVNLDANDIAKVKSQHSVADGHLQIDYAVSDLRMAFMSGVPPLRGVSGTGTVTGDTSRFLVSKGYMEVSPGHQLTLPQGSLIVPSTDPKPTPATITAQVSGPIEVLTELLSTDALKKYASLPPDAPVAKGQIDGTLTVALKLGPTTPGDDPKVTASAKLGNLVIEKLIGKQNLTNGDITLALDKNGLRATGDAQLYGAPTSIDIQKPAGTDPGLATIALTLDDAARARAGFTLGKSLTGPVTAKISSALGGGGDKKAAIEVDLARASVNNLLPGLSKAVGKPGKITLTASQKNGATSLDNVACDIGSFSLRGSADLDENGALQSARFGQTRLSPGDEMQVEVTQGSAGLKLLVRAANIDARPFLKQLSNSDPPDPNSKDFDLDLKSNVMTGQNSQVMTGVDGHFARRNGQMRKIQMAGRFGRAPFTLNSTQQGAVLTLMGKSADAGASLLFMDLYKRVDGGQLDVNIRMLDSRMDGTATIHNFALKEDPAMKRLTEESLSQRKNNGAVQIDASNLSFQKLFINFNKNGSRVEVKDGALFGPQLGATVQGTIDMARDKLALSGTFVPAYGVNNLFAQLPIVGPILGGGEHEGLFGLNYKISGSMASPNLSVDPLSALAPGFLRKIFGAISEAADQNGALTPGNLFPDTAGQ